MRHELIFFSCDSVKNANVGSLRDQDGGDVPAAIVCTLIRTAWRFPLQAVSLAKKELCGLRAPWHAFLDVLTEDNFFFLPRIANRFRGQFGPRSGVRVLSRLKRVFFLAIATRIEPHINGICAPAPQPGFTLLVTSCFHCFSVFAFVLCLFLARRFLVVFARYALIACFV